MASKRTRDKIADFVFGPELAIRGNLEISGSKKTVQGKGGVRYTITARFNRFATTDDEQIDVKLTGSNSNDTEIRHISHDAYPNHNTVVRIIEIDFGIDEEGENGYVTLEATSSVDGKTSSYRIKVAESDTAVITGIKCGNGDEAVKKYEVVRGDQDQLPITVTGKHLRPEDKLFTCKFLGNHDPDDATITKEGFISSSPTSSLLSSTVEFRSDKNPEDFDTVKIIYVNGDASKQPSSPFLSVAAPKGSMKTQPVNTSEYFRVPIILAFEVLRNYVDGSIELALPGTSLEDQVRIRTELKKIEPEAQEALKVFGEHTRACVDPNYVDEDLADIVEVEVKYRFGLN